MKHHLLLPLITALAVLPARAAVFTVTNSNNSGTGSLRQAISDANATAAADTINFNTAGHFSTARTITLTSGELLITRTTTIDAPAAAGQRVTVSGGNSQRVLSLDPVAAATVTLRNLTLRDGRATTGGGIQGTGTITALTLNMENCTVTACQADTFGGGMQMLGATVNLTDTTISANTVSISELRAATGGGIAASGGTLALTRCLISNNDAGGGGSPRGGGVNAAGTDLTATDTTFSFNFSRTGGGIYMSGGTAQLTRCIMTSNAASNVGGGLFADLSGQVTLRDTAFIRNTADEGGGIYAAGAAGGALTADACTFSNNEAQDPFQSGYGSNLGGGGLYLDGRVAVTLVNCTLSRNDSGEHGGGLVTTDRAVLTATNCTIAENTADTDDGAGVYLRSQRAATFGNCIIAGNTGAGAAAVDIGAGSGSSITSAGGNVIGAAGPDFINASAGSDLTGRPATRLAALLGPPQDNGGQTFTHALLFGSPAIEAGRNVMVTDPPFAGPAFKDQRGQPRITGGRVDSGAFEFPALEVTHTGDGFAGSLRDMIGQANGLGGGVIGFRESAFGGSRQTITLSTGQLAITTPITIVAPAVGLTISGNDNSRIFNITGGAAVTLERVHFVDGNSTAEGGAVRVAGATTSLLMKSGSATGCDALGGGAVVVENGTAQITDSFFRSNTATTGGGGAFKVTSNGTLRLTNSTVSSNTSTTNGGGFFQDTGTSTLINTTFTANTADSDANNSGNGGGLFRSGGTVSVGNSIVAANTDSSSTTTHPDYSGAGYTTLGHNLIGTPQGGGGIVNGANGDVTGSIGSPLNAQLTAQAGGSYYVPQSGSPATDAGDNALLDRNAWPAVPERDQRGQLRVINSTVDIGAAEGPINAVVTLSVADGRGSERGAEPAKFRLRRSIPTGSLAVTLNIEGSSTAAAADYTLSGPAYQVVGGGFGVAFPDGDDTIFVTVTPVDDAATELPETLTVSLTGLGYSLDPAGGNTQSVEIVSDEYLITSNAGAGAGSLRNAINDCNDSGGGKITLAGPMTITLSGTPLRIDSELEIIGNITTISAAGRSRVIEVTGDGGGCVKLQGLIITGGFTEEDGGGVLIDRACVEIRGCSLTQNHAGQWGGGLYDEGSGPALTVVNTSIWENTAEAGGGLALVHDAVLTNVTVARNSAASFSGGVHFAKDGGTATLSNCTITENTADSDRNNFGDGGGVYWPLGTVRFENTVVSGNTDGTVSGAIYPDVRVNGGILTTGGGNLIGNNNGVTGFTFGSPNANGDYAGSNALPLNPRLTAQPDLRPFYSFPPASLLTGHGINASNTEPNDQRGKPRIAGGTIDIGAVEMSAFIVNSNADTGTGTLRRAITDANAAGGGDIVFDEITFNGSRNITLTSGELLISSPVDIMAPAAPGWPFVFVNAGAGGGRVFKIAPAAAAAITLRHLALSSGDITANAAGDRQGGALLVSANAAVTLRHCLCADSSATDGGLVMVAANASLTAFDSTFESGAANRGGGLYSNGTLHLERCTVRANASTASGAGLYNLGPATLINSSFIDNNADGAGGGIFHAGAAAVTLAARHCTVFSNRSNTDNSGAETGGGIRQFSGTVSLRNTLLSRNREGTLAVDTAGTFTSAGFNLIANAGTATGFTHGTNGDRAGTAAAPLNEVFGPRYTNGGPTFTLALRCDSLSLDAGDDADAPATDQRGLLRRSGNGVDIGAYELQPEAYSFWAGYTFSTGSANTAENDDFDRDGVLNTIEYGAGSDPKVARSRPIITATVAGTDCHFDTTLSPFAPAGWLVPKISTNLTTWDDPPTAPVVLGCDPLTGLPVWRITVPRTGFPKRYARLQR